MADQTNPLNDAAGGVRIEVLSALRSLSRPREWAECSKHRWAEIMSRFHDYARSHAAHMAAHSWDVLLIGDRLFVGHAHWNAQQTAYGDWIEPGPTWTKVRATALELAALYDGRDRRFTLPEKDND